MPSFLSQVFKICSLMAFNPLPLNSGCSITFFILTTSIFISLPFSGRLISCLLDLASLSWEMMSSSEELRERRLGIGFFFFGRLRFVEVLELISECQRQYFGEGDISVTKGILTF